MFYKLYNDQGENQGALGLGAGMRGGGQSFWEVLPDSPWWVRCSTCIRPPSPCLGAWLLLPPKRNLAQYLMVVGAQ